MKDIRYDKNLDTNWNKVGELEQVDDFGAVKQAINTSVIEFVSFDGISISDTGIEEARGRILRAVRNNDYTEEPISVTVTDVDYDNRIISFRIETARITMPFDQEI